MKTGEADMAALEATLRTIGQKIKPECLVLIETTVAPGTTEFVAWPILKKAFSARKIKAEPLAPLFVFYHLFLFQSYYAISPMIHKVGNFFQSVGSHFLKNSKLFWVR